MSDRERQKRKAKPWDRPPLSFAPNRFGDRLADPIFLALGKAVSAWEGVHVAVAVLFRALTSIDDDAKVDAMCWDFAKLTNVHERAKQTRTACADFLSGNQQPQATGPNKLQKRIGALLSAYVEWSARRNELAHGYVTLAWSEDPLGNDEHSVEHYSLCPSHSRLYKWNNAEPSYNYVAKEIEAFAEGFRQLDADLETVAKDVLLLRTKRKERQ